MVAQYIVVGIVVGIAVAYAAWRTYKEIRHSFIYKNIGCAGCAFYDSCARKEKAPRDANKAKAYHESQERFRQYQAKKSHENLVLPKKTTTFAPT